MSSPGLYRPKVTLISLMFQHALIDACSAYIVLTGYITHSELPAITTTYVILYSLIAFGTQWIFGLIVDKYEVRKKFILLSFFLALAAFALYTSSPLWAVIIIGFANSLFHVSAGSAVLRRFRDRALFQGLFVAPGALGLLFGTIKAGDDFIWMLLTTLLIIFFFLNYAYFPKHISAEVSQRPVKIMVPIIILILAIIVLRSLVGASLYFPWKLQPEFALYAGLLTAGIFAGKALGGFVADKINYTTAGVGSLLISIPLILLGTNHPLSAVLGIMFFQMTMAVTLTLLNNVLNYREGLSFGLTTLALFLGMVPIYLGLGNIFKNSAIPAILILLSASLLYTAILIYRLYIYPKKGASIRL